MNESEPLALCCQCLKLECDVPLSNLVSKLNLRRYTTVSATMLLAARAGIAVFVTGGIGGVHRGGEHTMAGAHTRSR